MPRPRSCVRASTGSPQRSRDLYDRPMRAICLALILVVGCTSDDPVGGACGNGFNAEGGTVGDFGADATAQKVEALLHASSDLYIASKSVESDMLTACKAMATD